MTVAAPPAEDQKLVQFARRASAECRSPDEPVEQFLTTLVAPVREWCAARPDRVRAAYVCPPKDGYLWVYIIARQPRDFDLDDQVSPLGDALRANGWRSFVAALPPPSDEHSFSSFFDPNRAVVAYADR